MQNNMQARACVFTNQDTKVGNFAVNSSAGVRDNISQQQAIANWYNSAHRDRRHNEIQPNQTSADISRL